MAEKIYPGEKFDDRFLWPQEKNEGGPLTRRTRNHLWAALGGCFAPTILALTVGHGLWPAWAICCICLLIRAGLSIGRLFAGQRPQIVQHGV